MDPVVGRTEEAGDLRQGVVDLLQIVDVCVTTASRAGVRRRARAGAALRGLTLAVPSGQLLGLVGGPASGKTLIAQVLAGLVTPESGTVILDGRDLADLRGRERRRRRGAVHVVSAEPFPRLRGRQHVESAIERMVAERDPDGPSDAREAALRLLVSAGVTGAPGRRVRALDAQQRVVVAVARAVVQGPRLLVVDGISAHVSAEVLAVVRDLLSACARGGTAVLVLDGELSTVDGWCDVLGVLHGGRVVELADGHGVQHAPLHPLTIDIVAGGRRAPAGPGEAEGCSYRQDCLWAQDRCRAQAPPLERPLGAGHRVACYFPAEHRTFGVVRLPSTPGDRALDAPEVSEPTAREFAQG